MNLAVNLYDDALSGDVDQVVLVTNDTDLTPALEILQARCLPIWRSWLIGLGGISPMMSCGGRNYRMSSPDVGGPASDRIHGMRNRITSRRCWRWPIRFCAPKAKS
ncbi:hypothetical protein [Rhizobium leguminosarum]|uniref:hypothetical protein n=1 Tax=Rhizobium leguminosarum TaxID=384 RepID=UPI00391C2150